MYEYLKGCVVESTSSSVIIEVANIGYKILTPNPYDFKKGMDTTIYTYFNVREDTQELYGFKNKEIRELFLNLIKVNGVGPKSALAIIAVDDIQGLINAIETADVTYLTKFPKVGAKSAGKIILELKGKLSLETTNAAPSTNQELNEAMLALIALGYKESEVNRISKKLVLEKLDTNEYIRKGLKYITGK